MLVGSFVLLALGFVFFASGSSSIFISDGEKRHAFDKWVELPNKLSVEISSDLLLDCFLLLLDMPQGSPDLIDVSTTRDIEQCARLPRSFFGVFEKWNEYNYSFIPRVVLLNLLDDEQYGAFEFSLPDDIEPNWIFGIRSVDFVPVELVIGAISHVPENVIFPSRRVLATFKTRIASPLTSLYSTLAIIILTYIKKDNFLDWARVFFTELVKDLSDEEIIENYLLRREIIRSIVWKFMFLSNEKLVQLLDCYIFKYSDLSFDDSLKMCVDEADLANANANGEYDSAIVLFHDMIVIRRNEILFERDVSDEKTDAIVKKILKTHLQSSCIDVIESHMEYMLIKHRARISQSFWQCLCTQMQLSNQHSQSSYPVIILTGYFLGHVNLSPQFIQTHPHLANLPMALDRRERLNFDAGLFDADGIQRLGVVLCVAMLMDPEIEFINKGFAMRSISESAVFGLAGLSYFVTNDEQIPEISWGNERDLDEVYFVPMHSTVDLEEFFKQRVYTGLHLVPKQLLFYIASAVGLSILDLLDQETCVWMLENILERFSVHGNSESLLRNVDRYFPLIMRNKGTEWTINLLKLAVSKMSQAPLLTRFLHLMVIKYTDLLDHRLFDLLLDFGATNTMVFVRLFKRIEAIHPAFECNSQAGAIIRQIRPALARWLERRFVLTLRSATGGYLFTRRDQVK